ncbi:MAG: dihydrofolate reductase [Clostridiales bacterium]|jgi:dihydrofolate reductase|nr:dihydrofolate reductase [Clostridiales bacterium]
MYAIVAVSLNFVISYKNKLPWNIPLDAEFFYSMIRGQNVIIGRKSFENIEIHPENNYYIFSKNKNYEILSNEFNNIKIFHDFQEINSIKNNKEIWICGGRQIYDEFLFSCSTLYLTIIKKFFMGDVFFDKNYENFFYLERNIFENEDIKILIFKNKRLFNISL